MHKCKKRNCCRHWSTRGHFFKYDNSNKTKLSHEKILEITWYVGCLGKIYLILNSSKRNKNITMVLKNKRLSFR